MLTQQQLTLCTLLSLQAQAQQQRGIIRHS
jgi:hypothetical protein